MKIAVSLRRPRIKAPRGYCGGGHLAEDDAKVEELRFVRLRDVKAAAGRSLRRANIQRAPGLFRIGSTFRASDCLG